jgi:serine protease AprX
LETQALQLNGQKPSAVFNGQRVPIDDADNIPAGFEGYVQLALDLNLLDAAFSVTQDPFDLQPAVHATFQPTRNVTRAEYAVAATRWLNALYQ